MATQTMINGIDTHALGEMVEQIRQDPSKGIARFGVTTSWLGDGPASETRVSSWSLGGEDKPRGYTIRIDEPPELLGKAAHANPQEYLLAAMNACILATWVAACSVNGIALESLEVESEGELDLRGFLAIDARVPAGYETIDLTVRVKSDGTPEQYEEINRFVQQTSPNFYNMNKPIDLKTRVERA